jgi:hypothetical protein
MTNFPQIITQSAKYNAQNQSGPSKDGGSFSGLAKGAAGSINFMDMISARSQDVKITSIDKAFVTQQSALTADELAEQMAAQLSQTSQMMTQGTTSDLIEPVALDKADLNSTVIAPLNVIMPASTGVNTDNLTDAEKLVLFNQQLNKFLDASLHEEAGVNTDLFNEILEEFNPEVFNQTFITSEDGTLSAEQKQALLEAVKKIIAGQPSLSGQDADSDALLIATNITPASMASLLEEIENAIKAKKPVSSLVEMVPVSSGEKEELKNTEIDVAIALGLAQQVTNNNAAQLDATSSNATASKSHMDQLMYGPQLATDAASTGNDAQANIADIDGAPIGQDAAKNAAQTNDASSDSFKAAMNGADLALDPESWSSVYPDGLEWSKANQQGMGPLNVTSPAHMASLVTQSQNATSAHPATQMVSVTLQKHAQNGENKSITLQLDPPELGRIEVRLDFGKEKGMKAHIVTEKPEAYMMMQRDAQLLERSLQDAGIDTAADGLTFELAQDGNLFSDGHEGQNRQGGGSDGRADNDIEVGLEIIETTMSWTVDANGISHYDVLV